MIKVTVQEDWFDPNGTRVCGKSDSRPGGVPGFVRNRGPHVVRSSDGTPLEGVYKCVVRDTTKITQTVYVGIYVFNGTQYMFRVLHSILIFSYSH